MKIPTKDYSDYQVGDLIIFREGDYREDIGYISGTHFGNGHIFKMIWFKDESSQRSEETVETLREYTDTYVFPVSKQ